MEDEQDADMLLDEMNFFNSISEPEVSASDSEEEELSASAGTSSKSAAKKKTTQPPSPAPKSSVAPKAKNSAHSASTSDKKAESAPNLPDVEQEGAQEGAKPIKKAKMSEAEHVEVRDWDPMRHARASSGIGPKAINRVKRDIKNFYDEPPTGIFIEPEDRDISLIHALIVGPYDTPYEGGFFHFAIRFTEEYPMVPPKVKLLTTNNNTVRFNPNLYADGKVCLSILGTWTGPSWTAVQSLSSVLVSIHSLMNEHPYLNEPGFEKTDVTSREVVDYDDNVRFNTLKYAVCSNAKDQTLPRTFCTLISDLWPSYFDSYMAGLDKLKESRLFAGERQAGKSHALDMDSGVFGLRRRLGKADIDLLESSLKDLNATLAAKKD